MLYIVPIHHVQCPRSLKCWTPHQRVNEYELFLCRILLYVFWRSDLLWCWIMMLSFIVSNAGGFSSLCLLQDYYRAIIHSTGRLQRLTLMNWVRVKVRFHHPILWLGFSGEIFELSVWFVASFSCMFGSQHTGVDTCILRAILWWVPIRLYYRIELYTLNRMEYPCPLTTSCSDLCLV